MLTVGRQVLNAISIAFGLPVPGRHTETEHADRCRDSLRFIEGTPFGPKALELSNKSIFSRFRAVKLSENLTARRQRRMRKATQALQTERFFVHGTAVAYFIYINQ